MGRQSEPLQRWVVGVSTDATTLPSPNGLIARKSSPLFFILFTFVNCTSTDSVLPASSRYLGNAIEECRWVGVRDVCRRWSVEGGV